MAKKKLWESLRDIGVKCSAEKFREAIVDEFKDTFAKRGWSGDELAMHPHSAIEFCHAVRARLNEHTVPYDLILRTLINIRRRGGGDVNMESS
jgi:hypothetical protein